ncbi:hypothetical protein [Aureibacter tunicatorum]|uniref:Uncharacterized protein n=1 Tax=Aureibacter tunicatorum TaxID=866807 RepID=A0AAE3XTC2_9BACT|nr:hypothetical protein [Aureibacter tunicatorum]MDR6242075.1 hypothetical protein [Aureibacter tunicatorum]BDD07555.1 hypothetical protein AUTU_50380 [Aureibacter tunicatorum]
MKDLNHKEQVMIDGGMIDGGYIGRQVATQAIIYGAKAQQALREYFMGEK